MADVEINSFVVKFKELRSAGFEACLSLESKLGEVNISLNCKVGRNAPPPVSPSQSFLCRRSPSYHRRLERRKAERESNGLHVNSPILLEAEEAMQEPVTKVDEKSDSSVVEDKCSVRTAEVAGEDGSTAKDENLAEGVGVSQEELDAIERREQEVIEKEEAALNKVVERIIVSSVTKPIEKKEKVEEEIKVKLGSLGVKVKEMMTTDIYGMFEMSLVDITAVNLNKL